MEGILQRLRIADISCIVIHALATLKQMLSYELLCRLLFLINDTLVLLKELYLALTKILANFRFRNSHNSVSYVKTCNGKVFLVQAVEALRVTGG
jgi:hypothetical protein